MLNFTIVNQTVYIPVGSDLYRTSIVLSELSRFENLISQNPEVLEKFKALKPNSEDLTDFLTSCHSLRRWLYTFWTYRGVTLNRLRLSTTLVYKDKVIISKTCATLATSLMYGYFNRPLFDLVIALLDSGLEDPDQIDALVNNFDIVTGTIQLLLPVSKHLNADLLSVNSLPLKLEEPVKACFSLDFENLPEKVYTISCKTSDLSSFSLEDSSINVSNATLLGVDKKSMQQIEIFDKISCTVKELLNQPSSPLAASSEDLTAPTGCYWGITPVS